MQGFPIPSNENERVRELQKLRFGEWDGDNVLDELCCIAARLLGTPISHISLVTENKQIFAGKTGLNGRGTPREIAFCAHTIMNSRPFIVENADADPRFCDNPLVTDEPGVKSYLGIPLETAPGLRIGALCAVDRKPRAFSERDVETLLGLSQIAVAVIKSRVMALELDEQLKSAIALQRDMLPSAEQIAQIEAGFPLDVASFYQALEGIGGDIWSIEATGDHRVMLYIADFTGHGVGAALNAARFHSFVHVLCSTTDDPALMLTRLNRRLSEVLPEGQFATMFCATIDFKMGCIEYASAGAPPMLYRKSSHDPFEMLCQPSFPLGIIPDATYEQRTAPFLGGGVLALYTDGLTEMPRPPHSIFTAESLRDHLEASECDTSAAAIEGIVNRLFSTSGLKASDDITLVVARHTSRAFEPAVDYGF
ncbi:MAG: GAF domain-containing SpoIIE family protein phosphatase [Rhodomicrobium sp.]|jgi:serine phosphatase RsbU (regulator of sigma subunit)